MALLATVLARLKKLLVLLFTVLKKPFCCRRRSRRNSGMLLPMTVTATDGHHQHVPPPPAQQWSGVASTAGQQQQYSNGQYVANNSSNYSINSLTNQHISNLTVSQNLMTNVPQNRGTAAGGPEESSPTECNEDFFRDMVPQFKKTKKIVLNTGVNQSADHQKVSNRFGVDAKANIIQTKGLEAMDHFEDVGDLGGSWEDSAVDEMWDTDEGLRDLRQQERERRIAEHQRAKQEREVRRSKQPKGNLLATKIS